MKKIVLAGLLLIGLLLWSSFSQAASGSVSKTPVEVINLTLDFSPQAANGITLVGVTATNMANNADQTSTVVSASPPPVVLSSTEKVFVQVKNGVIGARYNVSIVVSKNDTGEVIEGNIILQVVSGA